MVGGVAEMRRDIREIGLLAIGLSFIVLSFIGFAYLIMGADCG